MESRYRIDRLRIPGAARAVAVLSAIFGGLLLPGCSLWHDDLPECPTGADVEFIYDYNVQRADMFGAHVGGVTVFVFDKEGDFITSHEEFNTEAAAPLRELGYRMHLDLPPGEYQLVARAFQHGTTSVLSRPGAKFRTTELREGDGMETLCTRLDRNAAGEVVSMELPLDTLWQSMAAVPIVVRDMEQCTTRIPLMRQTKDLHITLHQIDDPADIRHEDFEVTVIAANGRLAHDGTLLDDEPLVYTPWKSWTTELRAPDDEPEAAATAKGTAAGEVTERAAHMQLSLSRLLWRPAEQESAAMLVIRNRQNGKEVVRMNLPYYLAEGRNAFLVPYPEQEFLDREYDYNLNFFLRGDKWEYVDLTISILNWSRRFQAVEL